MANYDTLKLSKALAKAFSPEQAEVLAESLEETSSGNLVTKDQLFAALADLKTDLLKWIVGAIALNFVGTVGLMIAIARLVAQR